MQSAYRQFSSTETALLRVQNDLLMAIDQRRHALLVLLDYSSAFDTVDHSILLQRLSSRFGITDKALEWIATYLKCRTQSVTVGGVSSAKRSLACGVPQGSVIGPLLFTLYITPLEDII